MINGAWSTEKFIVRVRVLTSRGVIIVTSSWLSSHIHGLFLRMSACVLFFEWFESTHGKEEDHIRKAENA